MLEGDENLQDIVFSLFNIWNLVVLGSKVFLMKIFQGATRVDRNLLVYFI